jgi:hypothetical protein
LKKPIISTKMKTTISSSKKCGPLHFQDSRTYSNQLLIYRYIGGLILHNLQLLPMNTHEIAELQQVDKKDSGKSIFIGGGLYPTLALFNHSCDPGVVRYLNNARFNRADTSTRKCFVL